jgi:hypothetical protein
MHAESDKLGGAPASAAPMPIPERRIVDAVEENRARHVVDALRDRGIDAHLAREGVYQFGVRIALPDRRQAVWDTDDTPGLEAQVMRDGILVGYVPQIPGSENYDFAQVVAAIAGTDYDQPIATRSATPPRPAAPLAPEGGVFRRFLGGFRER